MELRAVAAAKGMAARVRCQREAGWLQRRAARLRLAGGGISGEHLADRRSEVIYARAGHDDCIAAAMCFFGDPKELPTVVLAKLHMEELPLDLQLLGSDNVIHVRSDHSIADRQKEREEKTARGQGEAAVR